MQPIPGQIWFDKKWKEHLFITKVLINNVGKYDWVYWYNLEGDYDSNSTLDGFIKERDYKLVSG